MEVLLEMAGGLGLAEISAKVDFSTEQVARMCAVSRRQLAYWAQKGIIPDEEGYSLATVERVVLIRRELARGHTLKRAVQRANRRLEERARFQSSVDSMSLDEVGLLCAGHLERVESLLLALRDVAGRLSVEEQNELRATVAGLRLHEVMGSQAACLSPQEILLCLYRAVEHLEVLLDDAREVV